jgi:hypothetical protein
MKMAQMADSQNKFWKKEMDGVVDRLKSSKYGPFQSNKAKIVIKHLPLHFR